MKIKKLEKHFIILIIITLFAFIFRIYNLNNSLIFAGNDSPFFASFALDLTNFNNPILWLGKFVNFPWGFVTPFIVTIWTNLLYLFNITINEFTLTLPITIIGTLTIPTIYFLGKELHSKRAGLLSALFLSILPLHVAQSRDISGIWIVGPFLLILTILYFIKYIKYNIPKHAWIASIFLTLLILSSSLFLGAIPVIIYLIFVSEYNRNKHKNKQNITKTNNKIKRNNKIKTNQIIKQSFKSTIKNLLQPRIFLLPALALLMHIFAFLILYYLGHPELGFLGHILIKTKVPGFYLIQLIKYFVEDYGFAFIILMPFAIGYGLRTLFDFDIKSTLLIWFAIFSFPFIFLVAPMMTGVPTYINYYIMPIILLLSMLITNLLKNKIRIIKTITIFILFLTIVFTINTSFEQVYRTSLLTGENYNKCSILLPNEIPCLQGSLRPNTGIKTSGYYIRTTTDNETIFTDFRTANANYYFGRDAISGTHVTQQDIIVDLAKNINEVDFIVIQNMNLEYVENIVNNDFTRIVDIYSENKTVLHIFSKQGIPLTELNTEKYDPLFDKEFGNIKSLRRDIFAQAGHNKAYESLLSKAKLII